MLNNSLVNLCEVLDKLCVEGYNTIDKSDIINSLNNDLGLVWDNEFLSTQIKGLVENKFIILKYQDDEVICLIFSDEGRELVRRIKIARQNEENAKKTKRQLKKEEESKNNLPVAREQSAPTGEQIMTGLLPAEISNKTKSIGGAKNFFVSLMGGILGGGISGAIITLLVLFL